MNRILLVVCFIAFGLAPFMAKATCLPKTAIVYGNGMFNSGPMSVESRDALKNRFKQAQAQSFPSEQIEYDLAFARSDSQYPGIDALGQLLEAYALKFGDDTSDLWRMLGGRVTLRSPSAYLDWYIPIATAITGSVLRAIYDHDMADHIRMYKTYLDANRVVIVAHSEDNNYANQEDYQLLAINPAWEQSLAIVSVATPAGRVADPKGQHFTVLEDSVINVVARRVFGPLNVLGVYCPPPPTWLGMAGAGSSDFFGHDFVAHYLNGANSRAAILSNLTERIKSLTYPGCTATPWKKVFLHEWNDVRYWNGTVMRALRDDTARLQFHAAYQPPATGASNAGVVTVQVESMDNWTSSAMAPDLAPNGFLQFVPIPSGVGVLSVVNNITGNSCDIYQNSAGECLCGLPIELGGTTVSLTSYIWDKTTSTFSRSIQSQTAQVYQVEMTPDFTKSSPFIFVQSGVYRDIGYATQYESSKSWRILLGVSTPGFGWSDAANIALVIDVVDGHLSLTTKTGEHPDPTSNRWQVKPPFGLYSPILAKIAGIDPASSLSGVPTWSPMYSDPLIPRAPYFFDQRVVGGDEMPVPGMPFSLAPNFIDHGYMAGILTSPGLPMGFRTHPDRVVNQVGEATTMFPPTIPWYVDLDVTTESKAFFGWIRPEDK